MVRRESSKLVYLAAATALMGALCMGAVIGYTAPALPSLSKNQTANEFRVDESDIQSRGWIASSMTLGALIGALVAGPISQGLGRRLSIILTGIPLTVGWILIFFAKSISLLIVGRILTGFCIGFASGIAPIYVIEISTPNRRGLLGTCFQVCVTIGIFLEALFGYFLEWRALSLLSAIPAIIMSCGMMMMPETPSWLLTKYGKSNPQAGIALRKLRSSSSDVDDELDELYHEASRSNSGSMWLSSDQLLQPQVWKPFFLALGLMIFQQFSGINAVMFYQTSIFEKSDSGIEPRMATIISCLSQVIATIIGSLVVDRLGRKKLLFASGAGHVISLTLFGLYYFYREEGTASTLPLIYLIIYIVSFSIGFGPIPWMMIPEMTPSIARSMVSAVSTCLNWMSAFVVSKNFEAMLMDMNDYGVFWFFASICFLSCGFVLFCLPETKGKTFEEIHNGFLKKKTVNGLAEKKMIASELETMSAPFQAISTITNGKEESGDGKTGA